MAINCGDAALHISKKIIQIPQDLGKRQQGVMHLANPSENHAKSLGKQQFEDAASFSAMAVPGTLAATCAMRKFKAMSLSRRKSTFTPRVSKEMELRAASCLQRIYSFEPACRESEYNLMTALAKQKYCSMAFIW